MIPGGPEGPQGIWTRLDPGFAEGTLADVLPAAAAMIGVPVSARAGRGNSLIMPDSQEADAVTVLLVDGLGWWPWQQHVERTPHLRHMDATCLLTSVPSTTPTALATLGTGMASGGHGIVGAAFRLPDEDRLLHPLSWGGDPHPVAVQPESTVFEAVERAGREVARIGASAYATSGLTRAALRGGVYIGADSESEIVEAIAGRRSGLTYAYLPDLDRTGHVHGVDSPEWRTCLEGVDRMVARILERIAPGHRLLVTADHGMVDCPAGSRRVMESLPHREWVITIAGEPRLRHVYVRDGAGDRVAAAWRDALGADAWVHTREEVLASGVLGAVEHDYAGRVGDVVVIARNDTVLVSDVDALVSGLRGQHGALTDAEMHIPLLKGEGHGHG